MLKDRIRQEFNEARKTGNTIKKSAIEAVLAGILVKEKAGTGEVGDDAVLECINKEIKVQREIVEIWREKSAEKSADAQSKVEVLMTFMPAQLSEEEVLVIIEKYDIAKENSPKAKGLIIKSIMPELNGKFDKSKVNILVEKYLLKYNA